MRERVWRLRRERAGVYEELNKARMRDFDFKTGHLVLVRNSKNDGTLKDKTKPRYLGPFFMVRKTLGGSYVLAEMDGTVSKLRFAAKRVVPFNLRSMVELPEANENLERVNEGMNGQAGQIADEDE